MNEALKSDEGKPMWQLMPFRSLNEIAKILTFGCKKYGAHNWEKGDMAFTERLIGASYRHLQKYMTGEIIDPETNINHLAHSACNLLMALEIYMKINDVKKHENKSIN